MKIVFSIPIPAVKSGQEFTIDLPAGAGVVDFVSHVVTGDIVTPDGRQQVSCVLTICVVAPEVSAMQMPRRFCYVEDGVQIPDNTRHVGSTGVGGSNIHLFELEPKIQLVKE